MDVTLYNSLSKKDEVFVPLSSDVVGVYACGPTVYDYVTIGNWRTYVLGDIVVRTLRYSGRDVAYVMNITDVGHLTGDNDGDADTGIDRMEKAKAREGKTAWDIARFYADDFLAGYAKLGLSQPKVFSRATDHIAEQIALIEKLEKNGLAYVISDGVYFDTVAYEAKGFRYGELSDLDQIQAGARVEYNDEKRNPRDFALWKFSPKDAQRDMEWESPWGVGFPGWHVECSAMSMKYLGEQFDIHIGGEDLKSTHHPNEIAQSEGATGAHPFVKYWLHGAFLKVDGGKMGKSLGNAYTLHDVEVRGFSPLALRYFYFTAHYRSPLNFTWEALEAAQTALERAYRAFRVLGDDDTGAVSAVHKEKFAAALASDLDMPVALSVLWETLKDDALSAADKRATILDFDRVLGFGFAEQKEEELSAEVLALIEKRDAARAAKDWTASDTLRTELETLGYKVHDTPEGTKVER